MNKTKTSTLGALALSVIILAEALFAGNAPAVLASQTLASPDPKGD